MKKTYTTYWTEYNFTETEHGYRPERIREFNTREEAEAFAATTADGKVVEITWTRS